MRLLAIVSSTVLSLLLAGCQASSAPLNETAEHDKPPDHTGYFVQHLANPADEKCLRDGYQVKPVLKNGIPIDSECINPDNGRKCQTWAYFRNECRL